MGRRAVPKIDPNLDLSRHWFPLEQVPRPFVPEALFARSGSLEVEVGSGKGLFLRNSATENPQSLFLGIELSHKYARYAAAQLAKRGIPNAAVIDGDALRFFAEWLPSDSVSAVHVYFPDPWWKKRHRKRRVMNESFLSDVERVLVPNGRLHFWTDVEEYFRSTCELIASRTTLIGPLAVPERPAEHDLDYRTHFERRMRQHNEPVYRAEYRKPAACDGLVRPPSGKDPPNASD